MLTFLVYDIVDDRARTKIADRCLDAGLRRIQKSVFFGDLACNRLDEVLLFSRTLLDLATDSLIVLPVSRKDFEQIQVLGKEVELALAAGDVRTQVI